MQRELPDWIDGWVEHRSNTEAPTVYNKWVAVAMIAAVLERKCFIRWDKLIYPNFYIVLVGPPAGGKGVAMGSARDMLNEMSIQIAADATTKERLAQRLQEATDNYQDRDTGETKSQSAITIFSEEFAVFLGYGNQELMPWLCDWYDCKNSWDYEVKQSADTKVKNLWLNIIGATTPELLQDVLPRESFGSGLNSRIIYVYADGRERLVIFPHLAKGQEGLWNKLLIDLQLIRTWEGEFVPDESYLMAWKDWYPKQRNFTIGNDPRMNGYVGRRPTHLHKLAMIMNASRDGEQVLTEADLKRGLEFLEEMEQTMLRAFSGIGRSRNASTTHAVLSFIRTQGEVQLSSLYDRFKFDADRDEMSSVLATIEHAHLIKIRKEEVEGKKIYVAEYLPKD